MTSFCYGPNQTKTMNSSSTDAAQIYRTLTNTHEGIAQVVDAGDFFQSTCGLLVCDSAFDTAMILTEGQPSTVVTIAARAGKSFSEFSALAGPIGSDQAITALFRQVCESRRVTTVIAKLDDMVCTIAAPILQDSRTVGVLLVRIPASVFVDDALSNALAGIASAIAGKLNLFDADAARAESRHGMVRLQNMFAALSATNEAILRTNAPEALYQRVCDAAVNGGKFTTTMILKPQADTGWMEIQAMTSVGEDMMRNYRMSIDATLPEGQGTVGIAYRSGKSSLRNHMVEDPRMTPWRERALKAGIASVAAVPLMREGQAMGVILFHSSEAAAFDTETVELLERMAENVVFAIDNFEREAERQRGEERIQYLATHDGLTGLPNRVMFSHLLGVTLDAAKRYHRRLALLFIDLDRFKFINDTLGHDAGDALLKELSARFKQTLRASDAIARLGGDEFVLLIQEMNHPEQASIVAKKILAAAAGPMMLAGQECRISASVGIAMFPEDGSDEQALTKSADVAMYHAKQAGKNNFQFYSQDIKAHSAQRVALESNLRQAIEGNELLLHYQPKVDPESRAITGVEALLRWNSAVLGWVPAPEFLAIAEETGLIIPIGLWALRAACRQNVAWQRLGLPPICTSVNLSARQLSDDGLLRNIALTLEETGLAPALLELEITESMVIHNPDNTIKLLTAIKEMGVRVAIDDFGTGYSLLRQLKDFPIDTIKIDRSFIRDLATGEIDRTIAQSMIAIGKTLSATVVAKGVETAEQQAFLRDYSCDQMQGYLFSKAVSAEDFADLLRQYAK